jgi:putative hydrolase of the HAD superfamily
LPRVLQWDGTPLEAILLDLDDTILDNAAGLDAAWARVARELSARLGDVAPDAVRREIEAASDWFWTDDERHRSGRLDMRGSRRAVLGRALEELGRPDAALAAETEELYSRLRDGALAPFDGALAALARLRERVPALGLVTNGASEAQRAKIERFDLARFFDVIVVEGEAGFGKPDRRVFERALGAVDANPERALMAGDNFECDVLGALGAGLHAVWIDAVRPYRPVGSPLSRPVPPRPHAIVTSFVELVEKLGI